MKNNNMEIIFPHVFWKWKQNKRLLKPSPKEIHPNKNTSFLKDVHPCTFQTKQNTGHKHTQNQHTMHTLFLVGETLDHAFKLFFIGESGPSWLRPHVFNWNKKWFDSDLGKT